MFKSCFSKVFTSCLSCFVYDKQRFNIVGFYGFLSKYVFLCFFTTFFFFFFFFNRYRFSHITRLYFDSCNLCKKKPLLLQRFMGLRRVSPEVVVCRCSTIDTYFVKFTIKHVCQGLFLIKLQDTNL